jgi:hypothetical protein
MKTTCSNRKAGGFNFIDLLAVVVIVMIGIIFLLPVRTGGGSSPRKTCLSNQKQLVLAVLTWAHDNSEAKFPMAVSTNNGGSMEFLGTGQLYRHFLTLSNYLDTPRILSCPSDTQRKSVFTWDSLSGNQNLSYFIGLEADIYKPQMILSGDRNITGGVLTTNNLMLCNSNTVLSWTKAIHNQCGNIGLTDGSVMQVSSSALQTQLQTDLRTLTNQVVRFAIP